MEKAIFALVIVVCVNLFFTLCAMGGETYHVIDEKTGRVYKVDEMEFNDIIEKTREKRRKTEKKEASDKNREAFRLFN